MWIHPGSQRKPVFQILRWHGRSEVHQRHVHRQKILLGHLLTLDLHRRPLAGQCLLEAVDSPHAHCAGRGLRTGKIEEARVKAEAREVGDDLFQNMPDIATAALQLDHHQQGGLLGQQHLETSGVQRIAQQRHAIRGQKELIECPPRHRTLKPARLQLFSKLALPGQQRAPSRRARREAPGDHIARNPRREPQGRAAAHSQGLLADSLSYLLPLLPLVRRWSRCRAAQGKG
mmetsp:Transcript_1191/g.2507  ORF Transcript_1191/g.2507 Transcript_1191/m.2507 type:complete len:231 (+) Transcript_1191:1331-2023(+)